MYFYTLSPRMNAPYVPLSDLTLKQVVRERTAMSQFTESGRVAVIANMLLGPVHDDLIRARNLLFEYDDNSTRLWEVNSMLCSCVYALGSVLDAIAAACQASAPDGVSKANFANYKFEAIEQQCLRVFANNIRELKFGGRHFNDWLNQCKHELPWVGVPSKHADHGRWDIYDSQDTNGFLGGMLKVVFDNALSLVHELYQQHPSLPPLKKITI